MKTTLEENVEEKGVHRVNENHFEGERRRK